MRYVYKIAFNDTDTKGRAAREFMDNMLNVITALEPDDLQTDRLIMDERLSPAAETTADTESEEKPDDSYLLFYVMMDEDQRFYGCAPAWTVIAKVTDNGIWNPVLKDYFSHDYEVELLEVLPMFYRDMNVKKFYGKQFSEWFHINTDRVKSIIEEHAIGIDDSRVVQFGDATPEMIGKATQTAHDLRMSEFKLPYSVENLGCDKINIWSGYGLIDPRFYCANQP